jgi:hypothetical protein
MMEHSVKRSPYLTDPESSPTNLKREAFPTGISSLFLGWETHHIVSSIALATKAQVEYKSQLSNVAAKKRIWRNVFNVPKEQLRFYHDLVSAIELPVNFHLNTEMLPKNTGSDQTLMRRLQGNIPDLVTFNPSLIDQEPWERVSAIILSEDQKLAEVSLL